MSCYSLYSTERDGRAPTGDHWPLRISRLKALDGNSWAYSVEKLGLEVVLRV
jgi:hypothetical protein